MRRLGALVWLRSRLWWHGLRSRATAADRAVGVILWILGASLSALLVVALSWITFVSLGEGNEDAVHVALLVVFWMIGFLAVVMPVFFGSGQPQVPLRRLLVFPFSHHELYRISLGASVTSGTNLFWYPSLVGVTLVAVLINDAPALPWLALVTVFAVCLVVWCNTLLLTLQWLLRRRSARELAAIVGLVAVVVVSMVPAVFQGRAEEKGEEWVGDLVPPSVVSAIGRVSVVFPPSIVADGLEAAVLGQSQSGVPHVAWLLLWMCGGVAIGNSIARRDLLEGDGSSRDRSSVATRRAPIAFATDRLTMIPSEVRAVAAKELHYLLRSTPGKFNMVIFPVVVIVAVLAVARGLDNAFFGLDRTNMLFVGLLIYAAASANNFLFNAYGWEGAGVQSFFLSPAEPSRIVFGKNIGVWIYSAILGLVGTAVFVLVAGMPPASTLVGGAMAITASLLSATVVGNFLSPVMPVAGDISSINNSPSQTAALATFGVLIGNVVVVGGCLSIPSIFGAAWLGPIVLAVVLAVEITVYVKTLRVAGRLLEDRRESLTETLLAAK